MQARKRDFLEFAESFDDIRLLLRHDIDAGNNTNQYDDTDNDGKWRHKKTFLLKHARMLSIVAYPCWMRRITHIHQTQQELLPDEDDERG